MEWKIMPLGAIEANCIILWSRTGEAWIVDPGAEGASVVSFLESRSLKPVAILLTHGHFDHIGGVAKLEERYPGLPVHIARQDEIMFGHPQNAWPPLYPLMKRPGNVVTDLEDGYVFAAGGLSARIMSTPGHTKGSVCIYFESEGLILTGDTLFAGSCGRTDFPGGDMNEMRASLARLAQLPPETEVVPGHGAVTTIGDEVRGNPYMQV